MFPNSRFASCAKVGAIDRNRPGGSGEPPLPEPSDTNALPYPCHPWLIPHKKRKRREDFHLPALTRYSNRFGGNGSVISSLVRRVVERAAVSCDVSLFALRH